MPPAAACPQRCQKPPQVHPFDDAIFAFHDGPVQWILAEVHHLHPCAVDEGGNFTFQRQHSWLIVPLSERRYTACMNRTDRLFALLLQLHLHPKVRGEDLARHFEVSVRTIYRDMQALQEGGVPVVSMPGEGYTLMEGYFLPPLRFTPEEARALFLGVGLLHNTVAGSVLSHARIAEQKIAQVLPEATRQQVEGVLGFISFARHHHPPLNLDDPTLLELQEAILHRKRVRFLYQGHQKTSANWRTVEPEQVWYGQHSLYVSGRDVDRKEKRVFRLSRMGELQVLKETFIPRESPRHPQPTFQVELQFELSFYRWVEEQQHYGFVSMQYEEDRVLACYQITRLSALLPWVLSWGSRVKVISPEGFRDLVRQEAQRVLKQLT